MKLADSFDCPAVFNIAANFEGKLHSSHEVPCRHRDLPCGFENEINLLSVSLSYFKFLVLSVHRCVSWQSLLRSSSILQLFPHLYCQFSILCFIVIIRGKSDNKPFAYSCSWLPPAVSSQNLNFLFPIMVWLTQYIFQLVLFNFAGIVMALFLWIRRKLLVFNTCTPQITDKGCMFIDVTESRMKIERRSRSTFCLCLFLYCWSCCNKESKNTKCRHVPTCVGISPVQILFMSK